MNSQQRMQQQNSYMQYQVQHGLQKMSDGSMQQGSHEQQMVMQSPNQRPQQRIMMMGSQQHSIPMQQRSMTNMQIQNSKQIRMINPQQGISQQQAYYGNGPPRTMAGSPMRATQQVQVRNDGIRPQMQGQHMIVRQGSFDGMQLAQQGGVIIQQQTSQPSHIVQSGNQQYIRAPVGQNIVRSARPTFVRTTDAGIQRIIRPSDGQNSYVIRNSYPMPSSSGEQQYQVVHQNAQQAYISQGSQGTVRTIRQQIPQSQPQQSPLQLALGRPTQPSTQGVMVQQPIVVIQQSASGMGDARPMVVDQGGREVQLISGAQMPRPMQPVQAKPMPLAPNVQQKTTPIKTPAKPLPKKPKTKPKSTEKPTASIRQMDATDTMGSATAKSKLISPVNLDRILTSAGLKDSMDSNARNALADFAECYADQLITELVTAAKHRKVNKIENKDAQFVIAQEKHRDHPSEYKKR